VHPAQRLAFFSQHHVDVVAGQHLIQQLAKLRFDVTLGGHGGGKHLAFVRQVQVASLAPVGKPGA
jgi:hypothetical protein